MVWTRLIVRRIRLGKKVFRVMRRMEWDAQGCSFPVDSAAGSLPRAKPTPLKGLKLGRQAVEAAPKPTPALPSSGIKFYLPTLLHLLPNPDQYICGMVNYPRSIDGSDQ